MRKAPKRSPKVSKRLLLLLLLRLPALRALP
jgi:hypothetical protein